MGKYKKYKNGIEAFLSGEKGQRFFNFAYSIGAAVVIWGALFKILHLPGGNALLSIGMGTEVLMFVLTAFDRPPREYHWEEVFPVFKTKNPEDRPDFHGGGSVVIGGGTAIEGGDGTVANAGAAGSGNMIIGIAGATGSANAAGIAGAADVPDGMSEATKRYLDQLTAISEQMDRLRKTTESLNEVSNVLLASYKAVTDNSENISQSSVGYVTQMSDLNRNIAGLNTIYEIQLKSISSQLDNIDRVNKGLKEISGMYDKAAAESDRYCEETQKMARYMQQLNSVYEKMITAMTINMYRPPVDNPAATFTPPAATQEQPDNNADKEKETEKE